MPAKFLFWTVPCVYMVYMMYIALFLISLILILFKTNVGGGGDSQVKNRVKRLIQRKKKERQEEFQRIYEIYNYTPSTSKPESESDDDESRTETGTGTAKFSEAELLEFEEITSLPFHELRDKLQRGEVTAVKVLHAFIAKTVQLTERLNCITEFYPHAIEMAENLDTLYQDTGDVENRPLFGIPVAIKDDHDILGMDSTLGLGQNLYKPALSSAALVESLVALGCVPFAKTNIPQTLLSNGSHNPIFGETKNSLNTNVSPAGSSSGSASLVSAGGGALITTGSDFGGSLRTPAHNCGISSIKPTIGRLSSKGIRLCQPAIGLPSVPGIMAKNAETVAFVFKHLTMSSRQHSIDSTCPPMSWNEKLFVSKKKLRIGYITSLPFFPSMGDTAQTILDAKDALENEGHFLTPFEMPDTFELAKMFTDLSFADEGEFLKNLLRKEPDLSPDVTETWPTLFMSKWRKTLLAWLIGHSWFPGYSKRIAILMKGGATKSTDLWRVWQRRNELRSEILDKMKTSQLDAILSPVFAFAAVKPEANRKLMPASYTMIWSCLDFPVGVTRFGIESGQNINEYDDEGDSILKQAKQAFPSSIGLPIGIQVISQPFHEETILRLLCKLDSLYLQKKRKIE